MNWIAKKLDILWRLLAAGFSFVVFGVVGLFLGIFIFPLLHLLFRNQARRQLLARRLIGSSFRAFIWLINGLGVLSYKIEGIEHCLGGTNQLIIANHPTLLDVVFLVSLFSEVDCVVKEAVARNLFMRGAVSTTKYIYSDDPDELLNHCTERLQQDGRLLLFPEGTRSVPGHKLDFRLGAAFVAVSSGADILPVTIKCTQPGFQAKYIPWYWVPPERPFFEIKIHPPAPIERWVSGDLSRRQAVRELNTSLMAFFEDRLK